MSDISGAQFDRTERMQKLVKQVRSVQAAQNEAQPAPKRVKGRRATYEAPVKEKAVKTSKKTPKRRSTYIQGM
jgi:hypothetical protein